MSKQRTDLASWRQELFRMTGKAKAVVDICNMADDAASPRPLFPPSGQAALTAANNQGCSNERIKGWRCNSAKVGQNVPYTSRPGLMCYTWGRHASALVLSTKLTPAKTAEKGAGRQGSMEFGVHLPTMAFEEHTFVTGEG